MTNSTDNLLPGEQMTLGLLESQWNCIEQAKDRIAEEVDIKSEGLAGNFRKQTLAVSDFFRSDCDYQVALNRPCVLANANPLARLADQSEDGTISPSDLSTAVHLGLCTLSRHGSNHQNLFRVFLYPILLTYFTCIGSIFISQFVLEPFAEIYAEFGIALPMITDLVLTIGYFVRTYTITILMVLFGLPPLIWLINWIGHKKREPGMGRLDLWLATGRPTVARWLLHVSLLMDAGIAWSDSIQRASSLSGKSWVKRRAASHLRKLESDSLETGYFFFDQPRFRMADTAIVARESRGQITLLQQVATWYRDTSSNIIQWFVQLLIPLYVLFILLSVLALVFALLAPMIAILGGLTGGGPGGWM